MPDAPYAAHRLEDNDRAGLLRALADAERVQRLRVAMRRRAFARHGIRGDDADDVFQDSVATWLAVNARYPDDANHLGILIGIFQRQSSMFLSSRRRRHRLAARLVATLRARRPEIANGEAPGGGTLEQILRRERGEAIRRSIGSLPADARDTLLALAERRATRGGMIAMLRLNKNTFDSRLRAARLRLAAAIRSAEVV